jgi:hypothetical protein
MRHLAHESLKRLKLVSSSCLGVFLLVSAFSSLIVEYFGSLFAHFQLELLPTKRIDNNPIIQTKTSYNSEKDDTFHF